MKKVLVLSAFVLSLVIILPAAVVLIFGSFGERTETQTAQNPEKMITVLMDGKVREFELEEYLFGVVAGEMPADFHIEALKAQAVAARTYILNKASQKDPDHPNADVCTDPTHCKAYLTDAEIDEKFGADWKDKYAEKILKSIYETKGEIAVYNGEPIEAVFHSMGSGKTENAKDVWGGDVPYLVSADSPGDELSPNFYSEITVSKNEFCSAVSAQTGKDCAAYIGNIEYNDTGSVKTIDLGGEKFSGTQARSMFSLPSTNFTVEDIGDAFLFHTKGKGHGVGMSQYGAEYYAENGMNYKDILKLYYKGIEIKNYGDLNDKGNKS